MIRTLIVDDVAELRALLRAQLSMSSSFDVVAEAVNGAQAVEQAEKLQPDLVLLDLAMPVMSGLEAVPRIVAAAPRTTIVMLSAFDKRATAEACVQAGARAFIEKGVPLKALLARLQEFFPTTV